MKKLYLLSFLIIVLIGLTYYFYVSVSPKMQVFKINPQITNEVENELPNNDMTQFSEFNANFEIYTNGTKRDFTATMYHNQSEDVFITNENPNVIQIKKEGITWDDFFKTLPFSLTKDCLVTGTQQTFCTNENQKLRFILNEIEEPDALDKEIKANDFLKVTYGN